ncbi:hypothetical protein C8Q72DRAFT_595979 [Fomitopsis betulina]|nr:hypothetical protein C8Q72DRAFT_595979 [Fomitopsis betulina]
MRRRSVYQPAPPDLTRYPQTHQPAPNPRRHTRTRTQSGPLAAGTRPRPSSPRPLHWRAGVYFGTPTAAYAQETGHRPHPPRQRPQYGSVASRWSPPKFATVPRQYGPAYATRRSQHQRRPTEAQVIAARYRTQKPLPPTPVSSTAGLSVGPGDSLLVHPSSSIVANTGIIGRFSTPRAGVAEYNPRVEERYVQEAYPLMMAAWYAGSNYIKCPRPRCIEAYPTLLDMAWHLQLHDYKSRHINSYGWPATQVPRPPGNPVFEVDLSGYHPRFSLKRVKKVLEHLVCLLTCTRCCKVCRYDPNPSF